MARQLNRLDSDSVQAAECTGSGAKLYADGGNLHLQVTPSGAKSWIFRYALAGKPRSLGLGAVHTTSLAEARVEALRLRRMLASGKDPKFERDREQHVANLARGRTFRVFAEEFIDKLEDSHRSTKAHAQWKATFKQYVYPVFGDVPLSEINVHMILAMLTRENVWRTKTQTMRRVRGRVERILGAAAVLGFRGPDNPARFTNYLSEVLPRSGQLSAIKHHPSLPFQKLPPFLDLVRMEPAVSYRALEFLTLSATRTSEVTGARWREIDLASGVWTIPAGRMKAGREHRVPLTDSLVRILLRQQAGQLSEYVFPGRHKGKPLSQMAMLQAMRGMRERGLLGVEAVPHGMRATFRTWAATATDFPRELAEAALAHTPNALEQSYQRGDQLERRRTLMEAWATYCDGADPT